MAITFQCPACHATHSASDAAVGRRVRCPSCDRLVDIPATRAEPESEAARPAASPADARDAKRTAVLTPVSTEDTVMLESLEPLVATPRPAPEPPSAPPRPPTVPARTDAAADEPERDFQPKKRAEETDLDMTPMVDVVFQLLIFFMLTAAFALQKSLTLPKPADNQPSENVATKSIENSPEYVIVRVDAFNTFHVMTVDWEEEAPSEQDLHIQLRRAREGNVNGTIPSKLMVEAHGDALHGRVVAALDAGTATGFEEVQLSTVEEE